MACPKLIYNCRFLPESPRWLLAKGRFEEGLQILETLARVNKNELPPSFKLKLKVLDFQCSFKEGYKNRNFDSV
jgi:hypothetical protein